MSAEQRQSALLRRIIDADDASSGVFFTASSQEGTTLFHPGFPDSGQQIEVGLGDIKALAVRGYVEITEHRDHGDVAFAVTARGHAQVRLAESQGPTGDRSVPAPSAIVEGTGADGATPRVDPERRVRQLAFDDWRSAGVWPSVLVLQKEAEVRGEIIDVRETAQRLNPYLGWIESDNRLVLRVRGFADLDGAEPYLSAFVRVVRLLYECYVGRRETPHVSNEDLKREGFDDDLVRRLFSILQREWYLFDGGQGDESGSWQREPAANIRHFRSVQTIDDYLRVVTDEFTASRPPEPVAPSDTASGANGTPGQAGSAGLVDWSVPILGFDAIEERLGELKLRLAGATTDDDFSDIGRRCRDIAADAVDVVFRPEMVTTGVDAPSRQDAARRLDIYLDARAGGSQFSELRAFLRAALKLANARTHSARTGSAAAVASAQGLLSFVRSLEAIERLPGSARLWRSISCRGRAGIR